MNVFISDDDYKIAEENGIGKHTLNSRIRLYGWPLRRAVNEPLNKTNRGNWPEIAEQNGINKSVFYKRVSLGWSNEKAATTPVRAKRARQVKVEHASNDWF